MWVVNGRFDVLERRLPWVIGRLTIIDRRRINNIPPRGNILRVGVPIPAAAAGDLWIVQGEYLNILNLLRTVNATLIGRFDGQHGGGPSQEVTARVRLSAEQVVAETDVLQHPESEESPFLQDDFPIWPQGAPGGLETSPTPHFINVENGVRLAVILFFCFVNAFTAFVCHY